MSSDNRWTALAAVASTVSGVACAFLDRRKHEDRTPELHERVALLEKRLDDMDARGKDESDH